ncbi:MAG: DUF1015 domain-containing protein [Firmicutes bacterium]|nr:DUF1015 domain-containing protein [Bacillota bacterium]
MKACFQSSKILLPREEYCNSNWPVVACDQFTSQPEYWLKVQQIVKDSPSTLHMIYPEAFLSEGDSRIEKINATMQSYMEQNVLEEAVNDGFILIERRTISGNRLGLIGKLDLDCYEYKPQTNALVRATEQTVESRIPPRVKIRENAPLELPHVMVLADDAQGKLIENLFIQKEDFPKLYDLNLVQEGGRLIGYKIDGEKAQEVNEALYTFQENSNGLFLVVGDGNHSLATAKTCWENIKKTLSEEEWENHPARYALVELVNLHSLALQFEPIHRLLFEVDPSDVFFSFLEYLKSQNMSITKGREISFASIDLQIMFSITNKQNRIPVEILQTFLDAYLKDHPESLIDYIHGDDVLNALCRDKGNCGILLTAIQKEDLFPSIREGHVLPRKTFSMGEANEKRYYMEARKIK